MRARETDEPLTLEITVSRATMHLIVWVLPILQVLLVVGVLLAPASAATRTLAILLGLAIVLFRSWQRISQWRARR